MQVFVRAEKTTSYIIPHHSTCAFLKKCVFEKLMLPVHHIRLSFEGKEYEDEAVLGKSGISSGSTLHLSLRLRGGGIFDKLGNAFKGDGFINFFKGMGNTALGFVGLGNVYDPVGDLRKEVQQQEADLTALYRDQQLKFEKTTVELEKKIILIMMQIASEGVKHTNLSLQPLQESIKINTSLILSEFLLIVTILCYIIFKPNHFV